VGTKLPSVAVLSVEPRGVNEQFAKLATDATTQALRDAKAFSRVVGTSELEAAIGFERQRQLANCDAVGCMAELAGAMGVDFVVMGSLGMVGTLRVLNLKLIHVRDAQAASVSKQADGDEALFHAIGPAVRDLLVEAGLSVPPLAPAAPPPPAEAIPSAAPVTAVQTQQAAGPSDPSNKAPPATQSTQPSQPPENADNVVAAESDGKGKFRILAALGGVGVAAGLPVILVLGAAVWAGTAFAVWAATGGPGAGQQGPLADGVGLSAAAVGCTLLGVPWLVISLAVLGAGVYLGFVR